MWISKFPGPPGLEKLGIMTVRLARLVLYNKLQRGQAQLQALGIENDIADSFKAESIKEIVKEREKLKKGTVKFITTRGSTF